MRDTSPILTRRMLALRQFPLFAHADLGELATLAENVTERRFAAGELVADADYLRSLHLVVEGRVAYGTRIVGARAVHGALEVVAKRPARAVAIAETATQTLELAASDYVEVLEDNFGLLLATVRDLATRMIPLGDPHPLAYPFAEGAPLGLVERMIILRRLAPFAAARLEALAILAHAAREARWPAGAIVRRANAQADSALIIIEGTLRTGDHVLGPGHSIGILETLAGRHHTSTFEAVTPVRALESQAATIFDVLEDHTDFALAMMQTFARVLVDADARNGCAIQPDDADLAGETAAAPTEQWRGS